MQAARAADEVAAVVIFLVVGLAERKILGQQLGIVGLGKRPQAVGVARFPCFVRQVAQPLVRIQHHAARRPSIQRRTQSSLPTVEPNAGRTLRITELRICHSPERLTEADSSSVRRSTVILSVKGEICSRNAPGAFTSESK